MKSKKTRIEKKLKKKKNPELVETIIAAKKQKAEKWLEVGNFISTPKRKMAKINIFEINKQAKEGDTIVVPGKVLGTGEIDKKIKIVALSFSAKALKKLKKTGSQAIKIKDEIKSNPEAEGIKIIK